ncbi:MAG: hypothetical protein PHV82_12075 [Victivallaceae bacterium]|nr:hypothetical protein [Victivallaceae bacterium]
MKTICPKCNSEIEVNLGRLAGSVTSEAKAKSSRENGKKGGRPKKKKPEQPA